MFRDGNTIYKVDKGYDGCHTSYFNRTTKKENYNKDALDIKREVVILKRKIFQVEENIKRHYSEEKVKELKSLYMDLDFWKTQMNYFDNLPSHKPLKAKTKKISEEKLYSLVKEFILEAKKNEASFVTLEDISFKFNVDKKCLPKIFMKLNKEGLLRQAKHGLMHDSNRGGYPLMPGERSDWAANIYYIRYSNEEIEFFEYKKAKDNLDKEINYSSLMDALYLLKEFDFTPSFKELENFVNNDDLCKYLEVEDISNFLENEYKNNLGTRIDLLARFYSKNINHKNIEKIKEEINKKFSSLEVLI